MELENWYVYGKMMCIFTEHWKNDDDLDLKCWGFHFLSLVIQ